MLRPIDLTLATSAVLNVATALKSKITILTFNISICFDVLMFLCIMHLD